MLPPPLPSGPLAGLLRQMTHYHIAAEQAPVPERLGVSYVWAGNGLFKYGRNQHTEAIVQVAEGVTPGLPLLHPNIAWSGWDGKLPASLLEQALAQARQAFAPRAGDEGAVAVQVPIEAQFLVALGDDTQPFLFQPRTEEATPGRVRYLLDGRPFLVDMHSHHTMDPFFSLTDDSDDSWLTASVVLGRIFNERPQLICRLNVYGHRQLIPALTLFDGLGPFVDIGRGYALPDTAERHAYRDLTGTAELAERATWWGALVARKVAEEGLDPALHDEDASRLLWFVSQALNWSPERQAQYLAGGEATRPSDVAPRPAGLNQLLDWLDDALERGGASRLIEREEGALAEALAPAMAADAAEAPPQPVDLLLSVLEAVLAIDIAPASAAGFARRLAVVQGLVARRAAQEGVDEQPAG